MRPRHGRDGVPCVVCGERTPNLAACDACLLVAIEFSECGSLEHADLSYRLFPTLKLAPVCCLCGSAQSEHRDHVIPKSQGGTDHWTNVGAACRSCNLAKGGTALVLTQDQSVRLHDQRETFRVYGESLLARLTDAIWWQEVEPLMDDLFEEYEEDLDLLDEERAAEEVADWFEDYHSVHESTRAEMIEYIAATAAVGGPAEPRFTKRASVITVVRLDVDALLLRADHPDQEDGAEAPPV